MTDELRPPAAPAALEQGQSFPGGWSAVELKPLILEQRLPPELMRRIVVPIGPLLLGAFILAASWNSHFGIKLAAWPVAIMLLGVFLLGVLNLFRSVRRARHGVRLEIDEKSVTGYPEARNWLADYFVHLEEHPRSAAKGVTLAVYRDPKRGTSARAKIRIEVDGGALVGPEASGEDAQWPEVRDALLPAAAALARALGMKLVLDYPWANERKEVSW